MEGFTDEQAALWETYEPARLRTRSSGRPKWREEIVSGFALVCMMEGVPAPPEAAIRAAVVAMA